MGASYSAPTLKSQLKMASQRLSMHRNKKSNQISIDSKQVAILLQQGKDESARIRCEAILHEKNLASAMEMLSLMTDLVAARVALITAAKTCPADLEEAIASIIYCSTRVEIPELKLIAQQFGAKWGKAWAEQHADNQSGKVHQRIQEKLSIQAPPFSVLLNMLHEIAAAYEVEWSPDIQALEAGIVDHSNPERLGSIAKIEVATPTPTPASVPAPAPAPAAVSPQASPIAVPPQAQSAASVVTPASAAFSAPPGLPHYPVANVGPASSPSGGDFVHSGSGGGLSAYPGTLNLILHRGRNILNLASSSAPHDLYVQITNLATNVRWKSEADAHGGGDPIWLGNERMSADAVCHFPLSVRDPNQQIQVEVFQQNNGAFGLSSDRLLGSAVFYAETLRTAPGLQWYTVYSKNMQSGYLLMATQFLPLNATVLSQEEVNRQQMWIAQEKEQLQQAAAAAAAASNGVVSPMQQVPGGPQQAYLQPAPAHPPTYGGGSGGAGGEAKTGSRRNSLSARVGGLFRAAPDSPPPNLSVNLSDVMAGRVQPQQARDSRSGSLDDGSQPGGRAHRGSLSGLREEKSYEPQAQQAGQQPQPQPQEYVYDSSSPESVFSEFPTVPSRAAGGGAKGAAALRPAPAASSSSSSSSSAHPAAAAADDPDGDLEARLRRLQ